MNALVERNGEVVFDPLRPYSVCVHFAFCRAFGFATLAAGQDPATAFFIVPALRAVTEDLILFRFLDKAGTQEDRDMVIRNLMLVDVREKVDYQSRFFRQFRPFQPVLSSSSTGPEQPIEDAKGKLGDFWRAKGWPRFTERQALRGGVPRRQPGKRRPVHLGSHLLRRPVRSGCRDDLEQRHESMPRRPRSLCFGAGR